MDASPWGCSSLNLTVPRHTTMADHPTPDQFSGCLLGLALGDALGAPVEAAPPEEARRYVALLLEAEPPPEGPRGSGFGQVTDDTQLARELLLSIAERGGLDPAAFAERLRALVSSGRLVGGGPATVAAARRLASGRPWHEAGAPAPYAGNGAAMRAGPLGLLYGADPTRLIRAVVDQARVTHRDSRSTAGAVAVAGAVAIASRRDPVDPVEFLEEIAAWMEPVDAGFAGTVRELGSWSTLPLDRAGLALTERGLEPAAVEGWHGVSSYVVSSVCWSLYAFLQAPERYWDAVRVAIRVGGDTDTMAAMTGAISGARLGVGALPPVLLERVNDAGDWPADELVRLARRVHQVAGDSEK